MKNRLPALLTMLLMTMGSLTFAQTRYLDPIFDNISVQQDITFGANVDFLRSNVADFPAFSADMQTVSAIINEGQTIPMKWFLSNSQLPAEDQTALKVTPLQMDVYTPDGDTETNRPVIIYLHTGNFLPPILNGGITGSRRDSAVVNSCKRWARAGYTAVALSYRLGWRPDSPDPDTRRGSLLQAVYRAIHDTQTGVRFLRASVAQGNPYNIDPSKIVLFGQGSGGYVAQAYNTLNDFSEIADLPKFIDEDGAPYVIPQIHGSIDGLPGLVRLPDPLQTLVPDRSISMSINAGGALADISWLNAGEAPMVAFHAVRDPFAPFTGGTVVVPTTNENVVDVDGSNAFIQQAVNLGNNDAFKDIPDGLDPFTDRARATYGQTFDYILPTQQFITVNETPEGLFPVLRPINESQFLNESGPWDWWDFATLEIVVPQANAIFGTNANATQLHNEGLAGNPGMGPEKGNAYLDTIQGYANPRIMCVLELPDAICGPDNTRNSVVANATNIFPNPANDALTIRNNDYAIRRVELYDIAGKLVSSKIVNANEFRFERGNVNNGVYLMQIIFDNERITKKVLFN